MHAVLLYTSSFKTIHITALFMAKITVLVIEDNPSDSRLVKEYLCENKRDSFEIAEADSLNRALEILPHYDFDAILLDLQLPDSSGLDTVRKIIAQVPESACIVLTGLQDDEVKRQAVRYGAQDVLNKEDLSPTNLSKSIRYSIERRRMIQEKDDLLHSLDQALQRIKHLEDILPFCINCKKILGEDKKWHSFPNYPNGIAPKNSQKMLCPECREDLEGK